MSPAFIALGGNLGDRAGFLVRAVERLRERGLSILRLSHFYETRPEGNRDEPLYLNAVCEAEVSEEPRGILKLLREVETELGRSPVDRSGPRTVDLDLLSVGDLVVEEPPELVVPHPRMHRRSFVLVPLCELDVHWRHPTLGRTAGELLAELSTVPGEVRLHGARG